MRETHLILLLIYQVYHKMTCDRLVFPQEIRLEFFPARKRASEQLRPVPGRPRHIGGAHRQLGPDPHLAADGRAERGPRPESEPEDQDGRRDRQENPQPHVPAEPVGRRTGVAHPGESGNPLVASPRQSP